MSLAAVVIQDNVTIPEGVNSLERFREWAQTPDFPEKGVSWFGYIHIDMSPAELNNNEVSLEIGAVLRGLTRGRNYGKLYHETALLTNAAAGLSTCPDLVYVSYQTLEEGRVEFVQSKKRSDQLVEMFGSPDMVLEVVSESSVDKDTVVLKDKYWNAGVGEYWLVDVRNDPVQFHILKREDTGWVDGAQHSDVFAQTFALRRETTASGHLEYLLDIVD